MSAHSIGDTGTLFAPLPEILDISSLEKILNAAMDGGGDYADVYVERRRSNSHVFEEGKLRSNGYNITLGVGIRVIKGLEVGYAYSDDLELSTLIRTASIAAEIARGNKGGVAQPLAVRSLPNRYPIADVPDVVPPQTKIAMVRRAAAAANAYDSRIAQVQCSFSDQSADVMVACSDGILTQDSKVMVRMGVYALADDGAGQRESGSAGAGGRYEVGFFESSEYTPEGLGKEAARMATAKLGALACPAGPQTVVLSNGWGGILLHEAVGHGLEADFIAKKTSLYTDKVGEKVASPLVTVVDTGLPEHSRGTINADDEGHVPTEKVLIEKGVLKGYMVDRLSGKELGLESTGSGRRESYMYAPIPRMTNTYIAAGEHDPDEIIASVQSGLYCASFGGGSVNISTGNFVFDVSEGYRIENGKITNPVKGATLIGVGPTAMQNVSMVGNDLKLDPGIGTCGKDGQSVPVGVGQPTIRIDEMTVGGTDAS